MEQMMTENEPGLEPLGEDARITSLDERLRQAHRDEEDRTGKRSAGMRVVQTAGTKILSDLVGIPLGSAVIGYLLDRLFGTLPWILLVMLFLGFGIAVRNVMRDAKQPPK
jgi:ATP synthase protein I